MIAGMTIAGPTLENRTSGSAKVALSAAIVRSHSMTSSQPPPMTCPCTAAMTGFFICQGGHLECELRGQMLVRLDRVAAPLRAGGPGANVVAGAEAAALGAQQDDAGRRLL